MQSRKSVIRISLLLMLSINSFGQEASNEIEYEILKKAYDNYDTLFFESLKLPKYKIKKGKETFEVFTHDLTPILNCPNNKLQGPPYYEVCIEKDQLTIDLYCLGKCDHIVSYVFLVTGSKPHLYFKGGRNYYKIRKLNDLEFLRQEMREVPQH